MEPLEKTKRKVANLHWVETLRTRCREIATDVAFQAIAPTQDENAFFSIWMQEGFRRTVIARALTAVREELAPSARHAESIRSGNSALPPQSWALDWNTTRPDLERALPMIDVFPRTAVVLLLFERVRLNDAAILLNSEPDLVRKAPAAGARELTINLARIQGWKSDVTGSNTKREAHDVKATASAS